MFYLYILPFAIIFPVEHFVTVKLLYKETK